MAINYSDKKNEAGSYMAFIVQYCNGYPEGFGFSSPMCHPEAMQSL